MIRDAYSQTLLGRVDARFLSRKAVRVVLVIGLAAVLIVPSIQFIDKFQEARATPWRGDSQRSALGRWLADARALNEGRNPYGYGHWHPNLPPVLLVFALLERLPVTVAGVLWATMKAAGAVAAVWLMVAAMRGPPTKYIRMNEAGGSKTTHPTGYSVPLGVVVMTVLFSARPVVGDLQHGNLNLFVLLEVAAAWYLLSRGRDFSCGLVVALAVVTKVTPALLAVWFIYKRAWRVTAGVIIGLLILLIILPSCVLGLERNWEYLGTWYKMMAEPYTRYGYVAVEPANQSLPGVVTRWLAASGLSRVKTDELTHVLQSGMDRLGRPAEAWARMVVRCAGLVVLVILAAACRRPMHDRADPRLLLELAMVLVAMHLLSERTWKHHLVTLPIVYLAVWWVLTCLPWSQGFRAACVAGLAVQWFLLQGSTEGLVGKRLGEDLLDRGAVCVGLMLCFLQAGLMLRAMRQPAREGAAPA